MTHIKVLRNDDVHLFYNPIVRCVGLELLDEHLEEANKRKISNDS